MTTIERVPHEMYPLDIWQWLSGHLLGSSTQFPRCCKICGASLRGNRLIGYRFPCGGHHWSQ